MGGSSPVLLVAAIALGGLRIAVSLEACLASSEATEAEKEVEAQEEAEAHLLRQELLQYGVRSIKAGESHHAADRRADLGDEFQDQELAQLAHQHQELHQETAVESLLGRVVQLQKTSWEGEGSPVDCKKFPMFCTNKVNCSKEPLTQDEKDALDSRIATPSGKANLRSWCRAYPMYSTSMQKCIVEGDSRGYAREMFKSQQKIKLTGADAIYCFVSGHCNNTQVTDKTTPQEAAGICDKLYGHHRWTNLGWKDYMGVLARALELATQNHMPKEWNVSGGWPSLVKLAHHEAEISAMTACAMGNFQCDVVYCQTNYCNNERFRAKFGNFSWMYMDL